MSADVDISSMPTGSPAHPVEFGKFYLLGLIARGGMAEVYRARRIEPLGGAEPELYAIKVMRARLASESRFVSMFRRESQLAMMLDSRCIVRAIEAGIVGE